MNREMTVGVWMRLLAFILAVAGPFSSLQAAEVPLARTNWTERWITNLIEVRMPENVFVDKFHTNWQRQYYTNVVELYQTNWLTENVTNTIPVEATRRVRVAEYKTNWNVVNATNVIPVRAVRTNFVELWRTNWKTLSLTNWQTVLVMKTNWVVQPLTNMIEIDMTANRPASAAATETPTQPIPVEPAPARPTSTTEEIGFEVASARTGGNNLEVRLTARWTSSDIASPLRVQQWHVESENGAILCSSQEQEFKRELPLGRYRVEVKGRRDSGGAVLVARGTLAVTVGEAVILPKIARK